MKKQSKQKQQAGRTRVGISAALIVIVIGVIVAILVSQNNATPLAGSVISPQDYQTRFANADHVLIDVRTPDEFATGHIHNALNIPIDELESRLAEVPTDRDVVLYCRSGNRSNQARQLLSGKGYTLIYDLGGVNSWTAAGLPLE